MGFGDKNEVSYASSEEAQLALQNAATASAKHLPSADSRDTHMGPSAANVKADGNNFSADGNSCSADGNQVTNEGNSASVQGNSVVIDFGFHIGGKDKGNSNAKEMKALSSLVTAVQKLNDDMFVNDVEHATIGMAKKSISTGTDMSGKLSIHMQDFENACTAAGFVPTNELDLYTLGYVLGMLTK